MVGSTIRRRLFLTLVFGGIIALLWWWHPWGPRVVLTQRGIEDIVPCTDGFVTLEGQEWRFVMYDWRGREQWRREVPQGQRYAPTWYWSLSPDGHLFATLKYDRQTGWRLQAWRDGKLVTDIPVPYFYEQLGLRALNDGRLFVWTFTPARKRSVYVITGNRVIASGYGFQPWQLAPDGQTMQYEVLTRAGSRIYFATVQVTGGRVTPVHPYTLPMTSQLGGVSLRENGVVVIPQGNIYQHGRKNGYLGMRVSYPEFSQTSPGLVAYDKGDIAEIHDAARPTQCWIIRTAVLSISAEETGRYAAVARSGTASRTLRRMLRFFPSLAERLSQQPMLYLATYARPGKQQMAVRLGPRGSQSESNNGAVIDQCTAYVSPDGRAVAALLRFGDGGRECRLYRR